MRNYYLMSKEQILEQFDVSLQGHAQEQAKQLLDKYGPNQLEEGKRKILVDVGIVLVLEFYLSIPVGNLI